MAQAPAADRSLGAVRDEYLKVRWQFRTAGAFALLLLGIGMVFYHIVERFSWLDSLYFCTITLTTIGYGDLTPHTSEGKLFTVFYVLVGVGTIAFFVNLLVKNAVLRRELKQLRKQ